MLYQVKFSASIHFILALTYGCMLSHVKFSASINADQYDDSTYSNLTKKNCQMKV